MAQDREPYSSKYCKEVNCQYRSGNKCTLAKCARAGGIKRAIYFDKFGVLAEGDTPDA